MLKGAIKCPDCEGSSMNKLTCRASSKHGGGTYTYYRCTGTGSRRKGCGNMVRMEVVDAAVNEIMATTFRVRVKRLILVKGTDYQDQLEEISYRIRALDPDVMSDEQFDEQVRRLRAERDRLKALPAEPDRCEEQLTGDLYADFYRALPRVRARRVADLARVRDPRHEERGQRDPGGRAGDSASRVARCRGAAIARATAAPAKAGLAVHGCQDPPDDCGGLGRRCPGFTALAGSRYGCWLR
jgi:hypothetical protein